MRTPRITGIHLDLKSGWSVGLEGYAGLTTFSNSEGTKGRAITGGLTRVRWQYVEIGAAVEASDYDRDRWRKFGGFAGAYFPFTNWVDIDATLGLGMRNYATSDLRYGPSGAAVSVPSLTLRLGLSDRPFSTLIGPRIGAALLVGVDLSRRDVAWSYEVAGMTIEGVTRFGGITAGLVMNFGFDVAVREDR